MIGRVREHLLNARRVAALTGAGISAESGIPTFRGPGGLWRDYRPEELATPDAFARDPRLVWEWYDWRRAIIAKAEPNPGHYALAQFEQRARDFILITQNVDGLHDRAGSRRVLKVHGDIWDVRCLQCGSRSRDERTPLPGIPPLCGCGGMLRPGVVWFGEALPADVWEQAEVAASEADVFIVAGTSAVVYPAAGLIDTARRGGALVVEVNIADTPFSSSVDHALKGSCSELLQNLLAT